MVIRIMTAIIGRSVVRIRTGRGADRSDDRGERGGLVTMIL